MLLISLLCGVCTIAVGYLAARTAAGAARDIRQDVFDKVESFSSAEFNNFSTASLITRSTNDVTQVQMVIIMMMRMVFYAPILGIGGVIRAIDKGADHVVDHRRGGAGADRPDPDRHFDRPAQVQDHPEPDRPAQPGGPREPVGHDGHPRLQHAGLRGEAL